MNPAGKKAYAADANRCLPQDDRGFRAQQNIRERRIWVWGPIAAECLNKQVMLRILKVMVGDEIQRLLGLLKIFIEGPKGLSQVKFFG
jgi:hypothetical protein